MDHARILNFLNSLQNQDSTQQIDNTQSSQESLKSLYEKITKDYSLQRARTLSREERLANHLTSNSLSYGEIDFISLSLVFQCVSPKKGGVFYDLGSGIGKSVIAASLMHQFNICKGIEFLHSLHEQACKLKEEVEKQKCIIEQEMEQIGIYDYQLPKIEFINGDVRELDWTDGTFLFASTTCFDPDLMKQLSKKAADLKEGSYFITVTKTLEPQSSWDLIKSIKVQLSWGLATIHIQQKKMIQNLTSSLYIANNQHTELIDYLKQENKQLTEQLNELKGLLQLNKKALRIMTPQNNDEQNKAILMVLKNLQEENAKLHNQIDKLIEERNQAQNQVLINQQITEEAQRHEKELILSLQNKIQTLQNNLNKAEQQLSKMEQLKPEYDEISGIVIKYKEICEPDKIAIKFHNQIEMLTSQLIQQIKKNKIIEAEKQKLQGFNLKLMSNLVQMKNTAMTYHGNKLIIQQQQVQQGPEQLIKFQNNLLNVMNKEENDNSSQNDNNSSVGSSPLMSPLPLKQENQIVKQMKEIPKLDLTKAKQIQEINAKRQIQQMQDIKKQIDPNIVEKINKYERMIEELRKNYQREMLLNKTLETANNELQRNCEDLESQIQILINSNLRHQEKLQKINKQYYFLQQFYINNKDQITTTQSHNRRFSQSPTEFSQEMILDTSFIDANEAIISNEIQEQKYVQQQMLQQQQQQQQQQIQQQNFYTYYTPINLEDSKKFLLSLAELIYCGLQEKIEQLQEQQQNCQEKKEQRFRSVSDIIDYQHIGLQKYNYFQQL
ncbi:unnamed protein product [Paramecium pentaurelia]|uniref:Histone-lysine N-methyltransferase, H3 lysine-79 specific n=1 Tax=Paramecium pentaurelia TaxID=43138 RepID=A0A8S1VMT3_9CILI|nr:unnamed protein product [Paramecium pentaurelia]